MTIEIPGLKLIRHNAAGVNVADDPTYPWRLDATFRPPEFMFFTFVSLYGGSEIICVRGQTREALEQFVELNNLRIHPRLRSLEITQPEAKESESQ